MNAPGWEWQQACEERELATIEALNRCAKAGVDQEAIKTLARECGIDVRHINIDPSARAWVDAYEREEKRLRNPTETKMANINEMIESKYLKQTDIDEDTTVTIEKVGKANVARKDDEPEYKWLIRFKELPKPMVLNSTNIKRLARACNSNDTDQWIGKQVIVYVDPDVEFGGNVVGGLRVRSKNGAAGAPAPAAAPTKKPGHFDDMVDDDIPFARCDLASDVIFRKLRWGVE